MVCRTVQGAPIRKNLPAIHRQPAAFRGYALHGQSGDTCGCPLAPQALTDVNPIRMLPQGRVNGSPASGRVTGDFLGEAETIFRHRRPSGAAPPPLIRTPLLTPAETCLKKPCTSVRPFMAVGMDGFDRLLEKLQPHLAEFRDLSLTPLTPDMLTFCETYLGSSSGVNLHLRKID